MPELVTVVTATWGRPRTLLEHAIPSVGAQTYPRIEHLIVTDGRDRHLEDTLAHAGYSHWGTRRRVACLGRNWTGFSGDGGIGAVPRLVGSYLAAGTYITYLDDDNDYLPHHVEAMVAALEESGADLACTAWRHGPDGPPGGGEPPGPGRTDTSSLMHRAELLKKGSWELDGYEGDGNLAARWAAAGAKWVFLSEPTMILNAHRFGAPDEP